MHGYNIIMLLVLDWRKRILSDPSNYACMGCDRKVTDHETLFETESERIAAGKSTGGAFYPLSEFPELNALVFEGRYNKENN